MRSGGRILIILGLFLAIVAGAGVVLVLINSQPVTEVQTQDVVVAAQPIARFAEIAPDQVTIAKWPIAPNFSLPANSLDNVSSAVGKLSLADIPQGSPIVSTQLLTKTDAIHANRNLSYILDKGTIALALPIGSESSIANGLQPGDHVDLIASFSAAGAPAPTPGAGAQASRLITTTVTQRVLQNVLVLGITPWTAPAPQGQQQAAAAASIVTLQISEQDALIFKFVEAEANEWTFVLRPVNDDQLYNPTPMTLDYINKKFGFQLTSP